MSQGAIKKRCGCRDQQTGKALGAKCPKLKRRGGAWSTDHGTYHYQLELPPAPGDVRRILRRGGFATATDAGNDLDQAKTLLELAGNDFDAREDVVYLLLACRSGTPLPTAADLAHNLQAGVSVTGGPTIADFLSEWIIRHNVDDNTRRGYQTHITNYLIPHLGHIKVGDLKVRHIRKMFDALDERNSDILDARASRHPEIRASVRGIRTLGPATFQRIRATLRAALTAAVSEELATFNAAQRFKLPQGDRPRPRVWTKARVAEWLRTGEIPSPVMIWTVEQTAQFLDYIADDPLYALYHLIAMRGLRRGEAAGLRRTDLNLDHHQLTVTNQIAQHGWEPIQKKPKSDAGDREVALDTLTVEVLHEHLQHQKELARLRGFAWHDTGMVFTDTEGRPLHPAAITAKFKKLAEAAGLPPIRLHDLRHGAASIAHAAGVDITTISKQLGHSSIQITADTYTEVFTEVDLAAAETTANVVPLRRRAQLGKAA
ncbi:site-specific integrase [Hamadaea sp. NPDC050747]|uniref:tyrosine-type recombinase/integrase n=1 Tax=Hamadaea sp. NPDC050747 TaxID=3155789 RepID=UPI0033EB6770